MPAASYVCCLIPALWVTESSSAAAAVASFGRAIHFPYKGPAYVPSPRRNAASAAACWPSPPSRTSSSAIKRSEWPSLGLKRDRPSGSHGLPLTADASTVAKSTPAGSTGGSTMADSNAAGSTASTANSTSPSTKRANPPRRILRATQTLKSMLTNALTANSSIELYKTRRISFFRSAFLVLSSIFFNNRPPRNAVAAPDEKRCGP
mmetsp:Transcript_10403/g.34435  ORF Transcript_10403/g.34435 Transcript_10403/m.34435 type:complete len:206 (+) Transcript_10403:74-691(+)